MPEVVTNEDVAGVTLAPASTTTDGNTVTEHSPLDVIEVKKYLDNQTALTGTNANGGPRSAWGRTRAALFKPPGGGPE